MWPGGPDHEVASPRHGEFHLGSRFSQLQCKRMKRQPRDRREAAFSGSGVPAFSWVGDGQAWVAGVSVLRNPGAWPFSLPGTGVSVLRNPGHPDAAPRIGRQTPRASRSPRPRQVDGDSFDEGPDIEKGSGFSNKIVERGKNCVRSGRGELNVNDERGKSISHFHRHPHR